MPPPDTTQRKFTSQSVGLASVQHFYAQLRKEVTCCRRLNPRPRLYWKGIPMRLIPTCDRPRQCSQKQLDIRWQGFFIYLFFYSGIRYVHRGSVEYIRWMHQFFFLMHHFFLFFFFFLLVLRVFCSSCSSSFLIFFAYHSYIILFLVLFLQRFCWSSCSCSSGSSLLPPPRISRPDLVTEWYQRSSVVRKDTETRKQTNPSAPEFAVWRAFKAFIMFLKSGR